MAIVVDTSCVMAVVANELSKPAIIRLTAGAELIAPLSMHWEVGNAFSAMFKRQRITLDQAQRAIEAYQRIPVRMVEAPLDQALALAHRLDIYAYDAYVIATAINHNSPLLTLDKGLAAAAQRAGIHLLEEMK